MKKKTYFLLIILVIIIAGCIIIPIPIPIPITIPITRTGEPVLANNDLLSKITVGKNLQEVKDLLGEPFVSLGPNRVLIYQWGVEKGILIWILGKTYGAVVVNHLFLIAFGSDSKVLKAGIAKFKAFDTITGQVREWLSSNNLTTKVTSPKLEQFNRDPLLVVYRPSSSSCSFPLFDPASHKPSVTVDGQIMGDLAKGEYLISTLTIGEHVITFDPDPYYRLVSQESIPASVNIIVDQKQIIYFEAYTCTGTGKNKMYAILRNQASALEAIRDMKTAW